MKATGIVRRVDDLGRVVIPIELRRTLGIEVKDSLEVFINDDETVILRPYKPACVFCGSADSLIEYKGKKVCRECLRAL